MKFTSARRSRHGLRCASLAILLAALTNQAWCQDASLPSLFPSPPLPPIGTGYAGAKVAAADTAWGPNEISPVQTPTQSPVQSPVQEPIQGPYQNPIQVPNKSVLSSEYSDAMQGGYGCNSVGSPCGGYNCCHNHYVYANMLLMTNLKQGGQVVSIDSATGDQRLNFCNQSFNNVWNGGFEVGTGWCLGGGCGGCGGCGNSNAIELVYWGVFPATNTIGASGSLNSMLNFSDLNYNGANANVPYTNAAFQQISYGYSFNSLEANLVGNCGCGPFGCGMCGCCCNGSGQRLGFGYVAGFRYMNVSDKFLYSSSLNGNSITGTDPNELNYAVATTNNLFGFQLGGGLSYCLTNRFTLYTIGKAGIYDNSVTAMQKVYGPAGTAVINNGPFNGQNFDVVTAARSTLAISGQFDFGARWTITNNWSANFGYRVLGLAGVATSDTNVHNNNFHDVDGIASVNRFGSFMLHGMFAGATYCF